MLGFLLRCFFMTEAVYSRNAAERASASRALKNTRYLGGSFDMSFRMAKSTPYFRATRSNYDSPLMVLCKCRDHSSRGQLCDTNGQIERSVLDFLLHFYHPLSSEEAEKARLQGAIGAFSITTDSLSKRSDSDGRLCPHLRSVTGRIDSLIDGNGLVCAYFKRIAGTVSPSLSVRSSTVFSVRYFWIS